MRLAAVQPDGATLRDHLLSAAASGSPLDPLLQYRAPPEGASLWDAFLALNAARPVGMGVGPVPPSELVAFQSLMGVRFSPWEVDTLMAMDRAALAVSNKARN